MRILLYKLLDHFKKNPSVKFFKLLKGELSNREMDEAKKHYDSDWANFINADAINFRLCREAIPKNADNGAKAATNNKIAVTNSREVFAGG